MSTQEVKLKAIADAIRQKEGTTEHIPANSFASRILSLETGGGSSGYAIPLVVTAEQGTTVTAAQGETVLTAVADSSGTATVILTAPGDWSVTASLDGKEKGPTVISALEGYSTAFNMKSRLPAGYKEVEYLLQNTASRDIWIQTDYYPKYTDKIEIAAQFDSAADRAYYLCGWGTGTARGHVYINNSNKTGVVGAIHVMPQWNSYAKFQTNIVGEKIKIVLDIPNSAAILNDASLFAGYNVYSQPFILLNDSTHNNYYCLLGKFYSCMVSREDTVIANYIPCIEESMGEIGIYDEIGHKFFPQSTSTYSGPKFTAGPEV